MPVVHKLKSRAKGLYGRARKGRGRRAITLRSWFVLACLLLAISMTGPVGVTIDLPTVICQERKVTRERVPPARLQHPAGASLTIWWCPFKQA